jgi:hypothetical protein
VHACKCEGLTEARDACWAMRVQWCSLWCSLSDYLHKGMQPQGTALPCSPHGIMGQAGCAAPACSRAAGVHPPVSVLPFCISA